MTRATEFLTELNCGICGKPMELVPDGQRWNSNGTTYRLWSCICGNVQAGRSILVELDDLWRCPPEGGEIVTWSAEEMRSYKKGKEYFEMDQPEPGPKTELKEIEAHSVNTEGVRCSTCGRNFKSMRGLRTHRTKSGCGELIPRRVLTEREKELGFVLVKGGPFVGRLTSRWVRDNSGLVLFTCPKCNETIPCECGWTKDRSGFRWRWVEPVEKLTNEREG